MTARALVIGVAKPRWGEGLFPELEGVPVDVAGMSEMLKRQGYDVTAPQGTGALATDSLQEAMFSLLEATEDGDEGVLYLTGHGYQVADSSGDEEWDEAFVTENGLIPDDWFRDRLWAGAKPGSRFVVVVDACHSESLTYYYDVPPPPPPAVVREILGAKYRLTLSACPDESKALDGGAKIGSVVTSLLLQAHAAAPTASYRELWLAVADAAAQARDGVPTPKIRSVGPDDRLADAIAFGGTLRQVGTQTPDLPALEQAAVEGRLA